MKKITYTLTFLAFALPLTFIAQVTSTKQSNSKGVESASSETKANYIKNQDYLSQSSLKDYASFYGDSLKGFDEQKAKADLLNHGVFGEEYLGYIKHLRREFINDKYNLSVKANVSKGQQNMQVLPNQPAGLSNGKQMGGGNVINVAPCVNEDFEATVPGVYTTANGISGWTISHQFNYNCAANNVWTPGCPEVTVHATPVLNVPFIGTLPTSPLGGSRIVQLHDASPNARTTKISQTFPVTQANTLFQFAFAGVWNDGGHQCCEQPRLDIRMLDCNNAPLACASISLNAQGQGCPNGAPGYSQQGGVSFTNWQTRYIDLTPYIGSCVTIEIKNSDCIFGGHYGYCYLDAMCGGQLIGIGIPGYNNNVGGPVSFCAGSNMAMISAPLGYSSYQWIAPGGFTVAPPQGTMSTLPVNNPVAGSVYTVIMNSASGCQFAATNTIQTSTVSIIGLANAPSCSGGSSGSATVVANGSGSGYTYNWLNANNVTVGTQSIVNGLAPGSYTVVVSGLGAAACGTAVATTSIGIAPPGIISLLKPFCNNQAFLSTAGGTNFQWYNGNTIIPANQGGTAPSYTVNNPVNGGIMWLRYLSSMGCQDSVKFTLVSATPGNLALTYNKLVCPNANNGMAIISMTPAPGTPPGLNSYAVTNLGTLTPAYSATLFPTILNTFTVTNLIAGGTYSVRTFDGSCAYNTTFSVPVHIFNYNLAPASATMCSGATMAAGVSFASPPSPTQYTYSWTPTNFLFNNIGTLQNTFISPVTAPGVSATVYYTITVTPTLVNCPISKIMTITVVNPATPTIQVVPPLCNSFGPYTINVSPQSSPNNTITFSSGITGTANPIGVSSGIITPSLAPIGLSNTFTVVNTQFSCTSTNTQTYQVSTFYPANLTASIAPLCVTSPVFNLMNIVQNTVNGTWSGPAVQQPGNTLDPSLISSTGQYAITYNTISNPNPLTCPHSTVLNISITNTIVPPVTPVPEFCDNALPFSMTVSPVGGNWSGNSGVSSQGVVTPSLVPFGTSIVSYSVVIGPCVNTATTLLKASKFNTAALTTTLPPLCYNSAPYNLMSIVQSTAGGLWTAGVGTASSNVTNNLFNTSFPQALETGVYTLTYQTTSTPNATLCMDYRTATVSVLNPPTPTISVGGPYCSKSSGIQMTVTPNTGFWTSSSYLNNGGILTPSLAAIGNNAIQYAIGTNNCNRQQTKFVSIEAFVPSTIRAIIPDLCNTNAPFNLLPITENNLGVWNGPGISGTNFSPSSSGAGNFVLTYNTASSPSGLCPDQSTVSVAVYSLAPPVLTKVKELCNSSEPVQINVSPVGGLFGGANNNAVSLHGLFNPALGVVGDNVVNYSITAGPCVAYGQTTVTISRFVSADFVLTPGPYCKTEEPVNLNSFVQNPGGMWKADGDMIIGSMFYPGKAAFTNNNKVVYRTYSVPNATLCPDEKEILITVRDVPNVQAVANADKSCAPFEVVFNTPNTNSGNGEWNFGDGAEPQKGLTTSHVYTQPGTYSVSFNYNDGVACSAKSANAAVITVWENPVADFTVPAEILISNPEVQFTNLSTTLNNNKYQWTVTDLNESREVNPVFNLPKVGRYQVTLTAETVNGCTHSITKTVEVKNDFNIFIPNSFSPNFDGLNDVFVPVFTAYGLDTKSYEMEIFDRWGHSLFRTKDPNKGWDGTIQNKGAEALKEEVYIYRIKYKDLDGNVYSKMGHLSLLK